MDIAKRLTFVREMKNLFERFDDRGLDAYDTHAGMLLDALDRDETVWRGVVSETVAGLLDLVLTHAGTWFDVGQERAATTAVNKLHAIYNQG